jgi:hypothetical protein
VGAAEVVVEEAANNAYIIRNLLVAVPKGSRAAVVDLKVSASVTVNERYMDYLVC